MKKGLRLPRHAGRRHVRRGIVAVMVLTDHQRAALQLLAKAADGSTVPLLSLAIEHWPEKDLSPMGWISLT
jgi:hypothetical protein